MDSFVHKINSGFFLFGYYSSGNYVNWGRKFWKEKQIIWLPD
jgi:hypothetical protein